MLSLASSMVPVLYVYEKFYSRKMCRLMLFVVPQVFSPACVGFLAFAQAQNSVLLPDPATSHCIDLGGKLEYVQESGKG
jgi:putative hemolysin